MKFLGIADRLLKAFMLIAAFFVDVEVIRELVDGSMFKIDPFTLLSMAGLFLLLLATLMDHRITAERREQDDRERRKRDRHEEGRSL